MGKEWIGRGWGVEWRGLRRMICEWVERVEMADKGDKGRNKEKLG